MTNEEALRVELADLDTEVLLDRWKQGGRLPWAEELLRSELLRRGIGSESLDQVSATRSEHDEPPSARDTIGGFGIIGRFVAAFLALTLGKLLGNLFGPKVAILAVMCIALVYLFILAKRVRYQFRFTRDGLSRAVMVYLCFEVAVIALAVCLGAWFLLFRGNV